MELREARVVPHDLADVEIVKQVDEVRQDAFGRAAVVGGVGVELQEADERRDGAQQLAYVVLDPLADEHAGAPQTDDQRRAYDDRTVTQSHDLFPRVFFGDFRLSFAFIHPFVIRPSRPGWAAHRFGFAR
jgi:hypothetical protein